MKKLWIILCILSLVVSPVLADGIDPPEDGEEQTQSPDAPVSTGSSSSEPYVVPGAAYTVQAKSAMLIEMGTNQVLFEQNADQRIYPASLTKIMTCMLTLEHGNLSDVITVSETAMQGLSAAGSTANIQPGEQLTLEELLYCMMLSSANEACNIAGEYVAGSVDGFVAMMNERAAELGCTGTHFNNPHGLHDENHYTTARDLSIIAREALKNETFRTITSTVTHEVPPTNVSEARSLSTTNLLITPNSHYYYEPAKGVKTGFTSQAGLCLVSTASNGRMELLSVLCGADYVFLDTGEQENQNFTETKALFEYGFANFSYTKVLTTLYPITQVEVLNTGGPEYSLLAPDHEVTALLPADYDEQDIVQEISLRSPQGVEAPIAQGQVLGHVKVSYQDHMLGESDLVAITDIPRATMTVQAEETKSFLAVNWWKILFFCLLGFVLLYVALICVNRWRARKYRAARAARRKKVIDLPDDHWGGDDWSGDDIP